MPPSTSRDRSPYLPSPSMPAEGESLGTSLRRARERRGVTIEAIAETTKISAALLSGLERDDLSRWPAGLFRRGFVRAYADAIGLPPELVVANFERAFPDGQKPAAARMKLTRPASGDLRLELAMEGNGWLERFSARSQRLLIAGIELGAYVMVTGLLWIWLPLVTATAVAGILLATYHVAGTAFYGEGLTLRLLGQQALASRRPRLFTSPRLGHESTGHLNLTPPPPAPEVSAPPLPLVWPVSNEPPTARSTAAPATRRDRAGRLPALTLDLPSLSLEAFHVKNAPGPEPRDETAGADDPGDAGRWDAAPTGYRSGD